MYSGVSEAAHSKLLLVTLEYVTLVGLGALVALVHLASDGSRALGLKLVLALTDLGLLKHKTMPHVTFTGSIKGQSSTPHTQHRHTHGPSTEAAAALSRLMWCVSAVRERSRAAGGAGGGGQW